MAYPLPALCDGPLFKGEKVAVIGGGNGWKWPLTRPASSNT